MSADERPLVSVGMPVYNAERHLAEALDALLAQDYDRLEIVISDNASTDATESICREYAKRDHRIAYQRSEENRGAVWNFNRVVELSHGRYFMWAAHDDRRAPRFVSACVAALEARPDAVMCCSEVAFIDDQGAPVEPWTAIVHPTGSTPRSRAAAIGRSRFWLDVYGLVRASSLARTTLARPVWGFDVSILLQLCLAGPVLMVREPLFVYRVDERKTTQRVASTLGAESPHGAIGVNWSAMALALLGDVWRSQLALPSRILITLQLWVQLCALNGLVGSGIVHDVGFNLRQAWRERRIGRVAALCFIALAALPVQNSLVRTLFRRGRPATMTRSSA